ncbi:hypothetical protein [Streptomyces glomeratus]|uniref:PknH-like extracellular domain-containing protein n=1 Tax=Streptomyces glomeratus TaxID=284452 RepID=A0ABP6LHT5_9ACTN|nr:hypothetical protein [Streptomyces glomeratus]MCF1506647.1 hypothetical protein [Streptomyces glomeratus]
MFDNQAAGKKFSRRGRTAGVAASLGAALLAVGIAAHPAAASADTGSPSRPAAAPAATLAESGLGSGNLIQRDDFFQQGLSPVGATVNMTGKQALSACSGEETMRALTKGKARAYADVTWTFDTKDTLLTESVADSSTNAAAASYEKQLNGLVRSCQDEPDGHWYYGKGHTITVRAGEARWYPAFGGNGGVTGGVAVIRSGHRFGIVELSGQPSDDPGYMEGIAAAAVNRLAD